MSTDNVTLLAFAAERRAAAVPGGPHCPSIYPARRAHSSKPAAAACGGRLMGHTDRQTDGLRTVTETMSHTRRAVSVNLQRRREYGINTAWHNCIARLVTVPVEWCSVLYGAGHPDTAVNHYIDQLQLIDFRRVISGQNAPSEVVPNVSVRGRPHDGQAHCVRPPRHYSAAAVSCAA